MTVKNITIAERTRAKRGKMSRDKLAPRLNVVPKTIGNWEAGRTEPRGNDLSAVERWLKGDKECSRT